MEALYYNIIEQFPFGIIFAKAAPTNIDESDFIVNYSQDFCYYYFSPLFDHYTSLQRKDMCSGTVNAARDFPDYVQYFDDDINVVKNYRHGRVLVICEPWSPPGMDSYVYTRKTALQSKHGLFMLGVFAPVDDVILGVARYKRINRHQLPINSNMLDKAIEQWFYDAFQSLPIGLAIVDAVNSKVVIDSNAMWQSSGVTVPDIEAICSSYGNINLATHNFLNEAVIFSSIHMKSDDEKLVDVGVYSVEMSERVIIVIMLRPSMASETPHPMKAWRCEFK
jgi:hypothetical protein